MLEFNSTDIKKFMNDLSIRKIPGVGRVNERLLESMGIKVSSVARYSHCHATHVQNNRRAGISSFIVLRYRSWISNLAYTSYYRLASELLRTSSSQDREKSAKASVPRGPSCSRHSRRLADTQSIEHFLLLATRTKFWRSLRRSQLNSKKTWNALAGLERQSPSSTS